VSSVFCFVSFLLLFFYVTVMEVAPKRNKGRPDGYVNTSFSGSLPQFSLCFVCITMNFGNKYDDVNVITCITFCRLFDEGVLPLQWRITIPRQPRQPPWRIATGQMND